MTESDRQAEFTDLISRLILWVNGHANWRIRDADCYRDPDRVHYGAENSLHKRRLARDLILDRWQPLTRSWEWQIDSAEYHWIGQAWVAMHPACRWGGLEDGNHFSMLPPDDEPRAA